MNLSKSLSFLAASFEYCLYDRFATSVNAIRISKSNGWDDE